ncbi:5-oxoprolinase subunit PxpB [Salibacterium salarium]|uniref:5-oxoprolinase subunit PxpB n=1 Tax=Salibacterium salarium TaxID=284579 RepID=A0A428N6I7_9BACI|nr:5-oxoprolinase subunit PxpB [Salibacterium salarium]RSL33976.1 5-oxoprolinase subunit PxpB [Salibacterium salarium]
MKSSPYQTNSFTILPVSETAVTVQFLDEHTEQIHEKVKELSLILDKYPFVGMTEYVPGFTSVTVYYDPFIVRKNNHASVSTFDSIKELLEVKVTQGKEVPLPETKLVRLPVVYGGEYGPDLNEVADYNGSTEQDVIQKHCSVTYLVYMIGFAPGFPYLGGMDQRIATPRKKTPRMSVPAGSVGIAGSQTGVYSLTTPGGWQIIGRTPKPLFQLQEEQPSLLQMGDRVQFYPLSVEEYEKGAFPDD